MTKPFNLFPNNNMVSFIIFNKLNSLINILENWTNFLENLRIVATSIFRTNICLICEDFFYEVKTVFIY